MNHNTDCANSLLPRSFIFWAPGLAAATNAHEVRLVTLGLQELDLWLASHGAVTSKVGMEGFWRDTETNADVSLPGFFYIVQQKPEAEFTMLDIADKISFLFEAQQPYVLDVSNPVRVALFSTSSVLEMMIPEDTTLVTEPIEGIAAESATLFQARCDEANIAVLNTYLNTNFGGFSRVRNEGSGDCIFAYIVSTQGQDRRADISAQLAVLGIKARLTLAPVRRVTRIYSPAKRIF